MAGILYRLGELVFRAKGSRITLQTANQNRLFSPDRIGGQGFLFLLCQQYVKGGLFSRLFGQGRARGK